MIPGITVSHMDREINWKKLKMSGVKFAFIRATEFPDKKIQLKIDPHFQNNLEEVTSNGIQWGAIHLFRTHIDPVIQAKIFCKTVGQFSSLPPVVDLKTSATKGERLNYKVRSFVESVEKISEKKPIIFTTGDFWRSYMCSEKMSHTDWAKKYPLWVSQYSSLWPNAIYPWAAWEFWQYTDKGEIPGIENRVQMNWFNGSEKDLIEKYHSITYLSHQPESRFVVEMKQAKMIVGEKAEKTEHLPQNFKGDFQEPNRQFRHTYSQRSEMQDNQKKYIYENGNSIREEDWLNTYFSLKA